ncbi:mitochondrial ribonuclease P catalytic subunit [Diachasmimorpha longicaudata]|uniref:mitochondrial ribonuclease P catalytic subunit n=1 Tax=Diachasmimorpha longicaudata TaxID=58733 RepID=UPI0030B892E7
MAMFRFRPFGLSLARFSTMELSPEEVKIRKLPAQTRQDPNLLINKYLLNNEKVESDMWTKIREELVSKKGIYVTPVNVDAVIMDSCCAMGQHGSALDYCDYLKAQNHKFNLAATAKYFKLLTDNKKCLSEKEKEDVLQMYDSLRKDYPLLNPSTAEACIRGLCKTVRWRESLELLQMIEEHANVRGEVLTCIIAAAFDNNEPDIAWEFMAKIGPRFRPSKSVYRSFVEYYGKVSTSAEELQGHVEKLFETLAEWDIYPWLEVLEEVGGALGKYGWSGEQASINTTGVCSSCGYILSQLEVNKEDFDHLANSFQSRGIIGKDIYDKTDPKELARFQLFVEESKPYDIVIDGLNVEYGLWNNHTQKVTGEKLAQVVRLFRQQGKKVVVMGRKHMLRWRPDCMRYIQNNARVFFANNISEDDPYTIMAALSGGLKTYILSRDLMRQHKFVLSDPFLQKTFKLWLLTRQIRPTIKGHLANKTVFLIYPPNYLPIAQKDDNGWHIPSLGNHHFAQSAGYDLSQPWYCLRKERVAVTKKPQIRLDRYAKR